MKVMNYQYTSKTGYGNMSYGRNTHPRNGRVYSYEEREAMRRMREAEERRRRHAEAMEARRAAEESRRRRAQIERMKREEAENKRMMRAAKKAENKRMKEAERLAEEAFRRNEIRVEKQKIPFRFILSVAVAFVLLLAMVFSFAKISEVNSELSDIEAKISAANARKAKLTLMLEEKNNLDLIEQLAIDEYHMIKEGSAQKKYITLSEGDSIVLEADEETSGAGFTGGMLSAVTAVFDDLLDYIK